MAPTFAYFMIGLFVLLIGLLACVYHELHKVERKVADTKLEIQRMKIRLEGTREQVIQAVDWLEALEEKSNKNLMSLIKTMDKIADASISIGEKVAVLTKRVDRVVD